MATGIQSQLSNSQVENLLKGDQNFIGDPFYNLRTTTVNEYKFVQNAVGDRILECPHSFKLSKIEVVPAPLHRSNTFRSALHALPIPRPHFLFHGTKEDNHKSIINNGFSLSEDHYGDTDKGYIGKGVYLSPFPEYSASYIKDTAGIKRLGYYEPVDNGVTCKLLGCIVLAGRTKQILTKLYGIEIDRKSLDSHWAWVDQDGDVTALSQHFFAQEYAISETVQVTCIPDFGFL